MKQLASHRYAKDGNRISNNNNNKQNPTHLEIVEVGLVVIISTRRQAVLPPAPQLPHNPVIIIIITLLILLKIIIIPLAYGKNVRIVYREHAVESNVGNNGRTSRTGGRRTFDMALSRVYPLPRRSRSRLGNNSSVGECRRHRNATTSHPMDISRRANRHVLV